MARQAGPGTSLGPIERAAIVEAIEAGELSCRQIARAHGVGASTVSRIAAAEGLTFDRTRTASATAAHVEDMKHQRAALAQELLDAAQDLLTLLDEPCIVFNIGGKDNTYTQHRLERPPASDARNYMTAAAVAIDKHVALLKVDQASNADGAVSLLGQLADGFTAAYEQIKAEEAAEAVDDDTDDAEPRPDHTQGQP